MKAAFLPPALVLAATFGLWANPSPPAQSFGRVPAFELTDQHGKTFASSELRGHPWVVDFVFTSCGGSCPVLADDMKELDARLKRSDARLVSVSVDPATDTPARLAEYARSKGATERWTFLTGERAAIASIVSDGFHLAYSRNEGAPPSDLVTHSAKLVLVDREGEIRGYYDGVQPGKLPLVGDKDELDRLDHDLRTLGNGSRLPLLNACLNATSALFLLVGFAFVKLGWVRAHATSMISALVVSAVFLGFYLYYHALYAPKPFGGEGFPKLAYLAVLITHVSLAVPTVVLALGTARFGLKGNLERHRRWARFTFPIWLYVSTSGVAVYALLYEIHGR